ARGGWGARARRHARGGGGGGGDQEDQHAHPAVDEREVASTQVPGRHSRQHPEGQRASDEQAQAPGHFAPCLLSEPPRGGSALFVSQTRWNSPLASPSAAPMITPHGFQPR